MREDPRFGEALVIRPNLHRVSEHSANRAVQCTNFFLCERRGEAFRSDFRLIQDFIGDPIADPSDHRLIQRLPLLRWKPAIARPLFRIRR